MIHYVQAIQDKGTADGFNTELSERLHIDFAKMGYRAGNRRDYIAHMTTWLARQEAVKLLNAYLEWRAAKRVEDTTLDSDLNSDSDEGGEDEGSSSGTSSESEQEPEAISKRKEDLRFTNSRSSRPYRIAKRCPFPKRTLEQVERDHEALSFSAAFESFLQLTLPQANQRPNHLTHYNTYKRLKITQPWNPFLRVQDHRHAVRAMTAVLKQGRHRGSPGLFDPVLVVEDIERYSRREKGSLDGAQQIIHCVLTLILYR
jgi:hypothetical protein